MRYALLISLFIGAPAVWSQTAGMPEQSWELIRACSEHADAGSIGVTELEQECPGIQAALAQSGYTPYLSELQQEQLTVYGLIELQRLAQRYAPAELEHPAVQIESLGPILTSLQRERTDEAQLSWRDRLERWLREVMGQQQEDYSWLTKWIEKVSFSEAFVKMTLYVLVGLLILLAIGVVVNEMRVAGVMRRGRRGAKHDLASARLPAQQSRISLDELERASPRERVLILLQSLVAALVTTGRLRTERSLTHRELGHRASFAARSERECFERIAAAAERVVYGHGKLDAAEIDPLVRDGRALHARLLESA